MNVSFDPNITGYSNTSGRWTGMNSTGGWSGGDTTLDESTLQPVTGTTEFPPLSQQPVTPGQTMPAINPADRYVLEKQSPVPPGQEEFKVVKNFDELIPETEKLMNSEHHHVKHSHAMSTELKILLENEKKVLCNVLKRCEKFSKLKEENKQSTEEWHNERERTLPTYESNLIKLINQAEDFNIDEDGIPARVQQKVLFQIVSKTVLAASNISVQLSMENTIINDIDASLSDLKQHSAVMQRQITRWLRMLKTLDHNQRAVVERWEKIKQRLKELRAKTKEMNESLDGGGGLSGNNMRSLLRSYDDRIQFLEEAVRQMAEDYRACASPVEEYYC